jgi:hypothetical protein
MKGGDDASDLAREDAQIEFADGGAELRAVPAGDMTVAFVRAPQGADFRPALQGLPGDMCACPHWGYMLERTDPDAHARGAGGLPGG